MQCQRKKGEWVCQFYDYLAEKTGYRWIPATGVMNFVGMVYTIPDWFLL